LISYQAFSFPPTITGSSSPFSLSVEKIIFIFGMVYLILVIRQIHQARKGIRVFANQQPISFEFSSAPWASGPLDWMSMPNLPCWG
jgi:hypothetical protein